MLSYVQMAAGTPSLLLTLCRSSSSSLKPAVSTTVVTFGNGVGAACRENVEECLIDKNLRTKASTPSGIEMGTDLSPRGPYPCRAVDNHKAICQMHTLDCCGYNLSL